MKAKLGIAPIAWWNDDLAELSDDVSLEECLRQASVAGFTGMETGRRFPMDMAELGPILKKYGISVCGGWFSGLLLEGDIEVEKDRIAQQMAFFKAAKIHPNAKLITGSICGVKIAEIEDPLMKKIRYMDKLVDELAKGRPMEKVLRGSDE